MVHKTNAFMVYTAWGSWFTARGHGLRLLGLMVYGAGLMVLSFGTLGGPWFRIQVCGLPWLVPWFRLSLNQPFQLMVQGRPNPVTQ